MSSARMSLALHSNCMGEVKAELLMVSVNSAQPKTYVQVAV